jgi:anti-sigma-K factor RskA
MSVADTRQALAAHALGVLPGEDAAQVEADAARDPALAGELGGYRATVLALERVLAREPAPPQLFEAGRKMPRAWGLPAVRPLHLGAAAAVALLVAAVGVLALRGGEAAPDARARVIPAAGTTARGEALLYGTARDDARLVLRLSGVPALADGRHYQVWVLRVGSRSPDAVGVFAARGELEEEFRLPGRGRYAAVDVSIEEDGGDPEHSNTSIAAGTFG